MPRPSSALNVRESTIHPYFGDDTFDFNCIDINCNVRSLRFREGNFPNLRKLSSKNESNLKAA